MKPVRQLFLLAGLAISPVLAGSAQADDLGRLFTNESERARIDALRAGAPQETTASATAERMVVNGTLQGSDGKRLVWLNGSAVNPDSANDMTLLRDGRVQLSWREGAKILKPGQGFDQATGKIFEYQTPPPPPATVITTVNENDTTAATRSDSTPSPAPAVTPEQASASSATANSNADSSSESASTKAY